MRIRLLSSLIASLEIRSASAFHPSAQKGIPQLLLWALPVKGTRSLDRQTSNDAHADCLRHCLYASDLIALIMQPGQRVNHVKRVFAALVVRNQDGGMTNLRQEKHIRRVAFIVDPRRSNTRRFIVQDRHQAIADPAGTPATSIEKRRGLPS